MIHPGPAPPSPERSYPDRPESRSTGELLARVLEALPVGIALFEVADSGFVYRHGNREFARVLSLEREPADGQAAGDVFRRDEQGAVLQLFRGVAKSREPQSYFAAEAAQRMASQQIWSIDAYPVLSGGRVTDLIVLAEQTREKLEARQRHQFEADRLRQRAEQLAELEKAKSEFLRLASHELRGPAAMLGGYLSMIEDGSMGPIPAQLGMVVPLLKAKAAQVNLLANEMMEAARLEDRRLQLKRKRVDFRQVIRNALETALSMTTSSRHQLRFDDQIGRELWVLGDQLRLDIIVGNLLDNAIKYSPGGGEVTVQLSKSGGLAFLSVRDGGIGIAPEEMNRLFVRFSRLAPQLDVPGTGLGLYLARELARLHGGDIIAVSKPDEGSEFTLSLPLEPAKK